MNNKVLAIIPARGGSKRLPGKNIKQLGDKPLIAWTIEAAKKSRFINRIVVSTDSNEIAEVSKKYGAEVPFIRPAELASDTASTMDVIFHCIDFLKSKNEVYDFVVLLQPTSPLRNAKDIENAFQLLSSETKAVVSVCETKHPPFWSNILPNDLSMKDFIRPAVRNKRSQDFPIYYRLNGALYISDVEYLTNNNGFMGESTKAFIMPQNRSVDIDSEIDFELCKILLSK